MKKNKRVLVNAAAREEKESDIPCYPVMGRGNMTVYAEPIYEKRCEYYRNVNNAEWAHDNLIKIGKAFAEVMTRYSELDSEAKRLAKELKEAGVKF